MPWNVVRTWLGWMSLGCAVGNGRSDSRRGPHANSSITAPAFPHRFDPPGARAASVSPPGVTRRSYRRPSRPAKLSPAAGRLQDSINSPRPHTPAAIARASVPATFHVVADVGDVDARRGILESSRSEQFSNSMMREPPSHESTMFCTSWPCGPAAEPQRSRGAMTVKIDGEIDARKCRGKNLLLGRSKILPSRG